MIQSLRNNCFSNGKRLGVGRGFNTVTNSLPVSPISEPEFDILFSSIFVKDISHIAVGVSGGPDSMALAFLTKCYSIQKKVNCYYYIVDHKLRTNSTKEANNIKIQLKNIFLLQIKLELEI